MVLGGHKGKMSPQALKQDLCVIVVAGRSDGFGWEITFLLDRMGASYVVCEDLYAAVGRLAVANQLRPVVVVAGMEELSREGMRFFDICRRRGGVRCCCLTRNNSMYSRRQIAAALKTGACIAADVAELETALEEILASSMDRGAENRRVKADTEPLATPKSLIEGAGRLSQAELDALLGTE